MADDPKQTLLTWLSDAHAFVQHGRTMLAGRADALEKTYPSLASRLRQHVEETDAHGREIKALLDDFGADTSSFKDVGARLSAAGHSWATQLTGETVVQSVTSAIGFEHFEIANYRALIVVADAADEAHAKATLEALVADDVAMAQWLEESLTDTTRTWLGKGVEH